MSFFLPSSMAVLPSWTSIYSWLTFKASDVAKKPNWNRLSLRSWADPRGYTYSKHISRFSPALLLFGAKFTGSCSSCHWSTNDERRPTLLLTCWPNRQHYRPLPPSFFFFFLFLEWYSSRKRTSNPARKTRQRKTPVNRTPSPSRWSSPRSVTSPSVAANTNNHIIVIGTIPTQKV